MNKLLNLVESFISLLTDYFSFAEDKRAWCPVRINNNIDRY